MSVAARLGQLCATVAPTMDPGFASDGLRNIIWQVKRKLEGLPRLDSPLESVGPQMLVVSGEERAGTIDFVRCFCSPVQEMAVTVNFRDLLSRRRNDLWSNAVLILADMKRTISGDLNYLIKANYLLRRLPKSQEEVRVPQRSTLIGTTTPPGVVNNTGTHRCLQLRYAPQGQIDRLLREYDWISLWRSVQPDDADPLLHRLDALMAEQATYETERR